MKLLKKVLILLLLLALLAGCSVKDKIVEGIIDKVVEEGQSEPEIQEPVEEKEPEIKEKQPNDPYDPSTWDPELYDKERVNVYKLYLTDEERDLCTGIINRDKATNVTPIRLLTQWRTPTRSNITYAAYYKQTGEYWYVTIVIEQSGKSFIEGIGRISTLGTMQYIDAKEGVIDEDLQSIWNKANSYGELNNLHPIKLLKTQVTNGMNYNYLAEDNKGQLKEVVIFVNLAKVHSIKSITNYE